SIGFGERDFDELGYARQVAQRFGTEHHELVVEPHALDVLPSLVRHYGEPYGDSSAIPTYYVAQMTRQHVTVALNGDGGDELLAGGYAPRSPLSRTSTRWMPCSAPTRCSTCPKTCSPKSTSPAWPTRSRRARRCSITAWSSSAPRCLPASSSAAARRSGCCAN